MHHFALIPAIALAAAGLVLASHPAQAANARHPYQNVDRSNDKGNDTGDSKVDALNDAQLNQNYKGPMEQRAPAMSGSSMPMSGSSMPMSGSSMPMSGSTATKP